jgi:hypothetical protein
MGMTRFSPAGYVKIAKKRQGKLVFTVSIATSSHLQTTIYRILYSLHLQIFHGYAMISKT